MPRQQFSVTTIPTAWRAGVAAAAFALLLGAATVARADVPATVAPGDPSASAAKKRAYERYALTHAGDANRGQALFADEKQFKCAVCHKVLGKGGVGTFAAGPRRPVDLRFASDGGLFILLRNA